jgi:hypothetical protein
MKKGYVSDRNFMILIASIAIVVIFALVIFAYADRTNIKSECSSVDECGLECGNLTPACIFDASNEGNCHCIDISI